MTPQTTGYFLLSWLAILAAYSLAARVFGGIDATVSVVVWEFCQANPIAAFVLGGVAAHWLWPTR